MVPSSPRPKKVSDSIRMLASNARAAFSVRASFKGPWKPPFSPRTLYWMVETCSWVGAAGPGGAALWGGVVVGGDRVDKGIGGGRGKWGSRGGGGGGEWGPAGGCPVREHHLVAGGGEREGV
jgi:hypothetical protein